MIKINPNISNLNIGEWINHSKKRHNGLVFKKFKNMFTRNKPERYDAEMLKIGIRKIERKTVNQNLPVINVNIKQIGFKEEIAQVNHPFLLSCSEPIEKCI